MSKPATTIPAGVQFYMYVGLCITAWAKVDEEIFDILVDVLGTTRELSSIFYYRMKTLSGRLDLVDELVRSVLPRPEKKSGGHLHSLAMDWTKTKKVVQGLFGTRTQIAHHPVDSKITFRYKQSGELVPPGALVPISDATYEDSYHIYMGQSERLRGGHEQTKPLDADALSLHCQAVQTAATKINQFRSAKLVPHLEAIRKSTPESNAQ